jgi:hypothetical protein
MESYPLGDDVDVLAEGLQVFAWSDQKAGVKSNREKSVFFVKGDRVARLGVAFITPRPEGLNLSGGVMTIGYRSTQALDGATITFKPANPNSSDVPALITKELLTRLSVTAASTSELSVMLPATPGLKNIKEVVITHESNTGQAGRFDDRKIHREASQWAGHSSGQLKSCTEPSRRLRKS